MCESVILVACSLEANASHISVPISIEYFRDG